MTVAATPARVLAIGAHPDDVELGCGGTLARWIAEGAVVHLLTMSMGEHGGDPDERRREGEDAAAELGATLHQLPFTAASLSGDLRRLIAPIEHVVEVGDPTVVLTHSPHDRHQDHRAVAAATTIAVRDAVVSVLAYSHAICADGFAPTCYVDISGTLERKAKLVAMHASQATKAYMSADAIEVDARYRGLQLRGCGVYEAFEVVRTIV